MIKMTEARLAAASSFRTAALAGNYPAAHDVALDLIRICAEVGDDAGVAEWTRRARDLNGRPASNRYLASVAR